MIGNNVPPFSRLRITNGTVVLATPKKNNVNEIPNISGLLFPGHQFEGDMLC
jgi:hypothetical protein